MGRIPHAVCVGIHMRGLGSTFGTAVVSLLLVDVQSMGIQLILGIKGRHCITKRRVSLEEINLLLQRKKS